MPKIYHSSEEPNYRTPADLYAALDRQFHFVVDAAANQANHLVPVWYGPGGEFENALAHPWALEAYYGSGDPLAHPPAHFLNPPYSKKRIEELTQVGADEAAKASYRIEAWAEKCYVEAQRGLPIVGLFPYSTDTIWWRFWVCGHWGETKQEAESPPAMYWRGFAASEVWRLPHRIKFLAPDGTPMKDTAGVKHAIVIWRPNPGYVGPWQPVERYWSYREP